MKTAAFATALLVAAVARSGGADAAECTNDQLLQIDAINKSNRASSACSKYSSLSASSTLSAQICRDSACLAEIKSNIAKYPSCTSSGVDIKQLTTLAVNECAKSSGSMSTLTPTTTTKTPSTSTSTLRTPSPSPSSGGSDAISDSSNSSSFPTGKTGSGAVSTTASSTMVVLTSAIVVAVVAL